MISSRSTSSAWLVGTPMKTLLSSLSLLSSSRSAVMNTNAWHTWIAKAPIIEVSYTTAMTRRNAQKSRRNDSPAGPATRTPAHVPPSGNAAIYCRKSKKGDRQQISVTRQKKLALKDCEELGLTVAPEHVYIDNGESAWQRNRKRPGWDALLEAARRGEIKHIVCYHPDRLMRQPHDLEELLSISDRHGILLYGRVNRRDLQDPDDRYALRIEVAHACRSSDDTSRRVKDERRERAENGMPAPGGKRRYGYTPNGMHIIEKEAKIVREIFRRYVNGEGSRTLARDLNARGITTAKGKAWTSDSIRKILDSRHVVGIRVHRGEEIGTGTWPTIIDRATWDLAREMREFRNATHDTRANRYYLLRGAVICSRCGTNMCGNNGQYKCSRNMRGDALRGARGINAAKLEEFVEAAAVEYLKKLTVDARHSTARTRQAEQAQAEIADDEKQLEELNDMWTHKELTTKEYRKMRSEILARMERNEKKATVRPIKALEGLAGPHAPETWNGLSADHKNSVIRLIFSVIIDEHPKGGRVFDYDRIDIEENELG
jgi:site-specific DNA recombinase